MSLARDQLIADWRAELAVAENECAAGERPVWLARVRSRLYRLLLALYGDGQWRADDPPGIAAEPPPANSMVCDAPDVLPLSGKPAKQLGQIRAALKSVANARETPAAAGPLAGGVGQGKWALVASGAELDLAKTAQLLADAGIFFRVASFGGEEAITVPSAQADAARDLVARRRWRLKRKRIPVKPAPRASSISDGFLVPMGLSLPFALLAIAAVNSRYPDAIAKGQAYEAALYAAAVFGGLLAFTLVRPISRFVLWCERHISSRLAIVRRSLRSKH